jgi:hypothetical protein
VRFCTKNWTKKLDKLCQISNRNDTKSKQVITFHTQVQNLTSITFNQEEQNTLALGFQYNFEKPTNQFITDLIIDTENAIWKLDPEIQNTYRYLASKESKKYQHLI